MKKVRRTWGIYEVLNYGPGWKLKRLIINPKSVSSIQRHFKRAEFWWYVRSKKKEYIPIGMWHQLKNYSDKPDYRVTSWFKVYRRRYRKKKLINMST